MKMITLLFISVLNGCMSFGCTYVGAKLDNWELCDIDGFPYVSARFAARKLEYEDSEKFIRIVESCIERGQITNDEFVFRDDFRITNTKVQTIDDETFGRPIEKAFRRRLMFMR